MQGRIITAPMTAPAPDTAAAAHPVLFRHALRVYWEDTDAGGVVFYANYLKFFERARTEWLRHLGVGQQALREATGAVFVVTDTQVHFRTPARLDDVLHITVALRRHGTASMRRRHPHRLCRPGNVSPTPCPQRSAFFDQVNR
jgi:tol-pal system-associated acyl-CoA thioesterase